ncbi:MAG: DeoR/GlpR family DNA-binding transcription regulator [Eubacteriales bacterium]|nr:DeoR/GlpR family DNA-binding transcription regulator [Eubacteriales bacterium]
MLARQRQSYILDQLEKNGIVYTSALVKEMKVSSETVRKDLDGLEQAGSLVRVHGGAVSAEKEPSAVPAAEAAPYISFQIRSTQHLEQKAAIAARAADLVEEDQVIALDYGSTSQIMAMELKRRFRRLTVITNSIQNALILSECPDFTVILIGGILNKNELTLGNDFTAMLDYLHIDILFMTASGIHPEIGCTDQSPMETRVQNQMRQAASRTVVLADSSKCGRASLVKICPLQEISALITDSGLDEELAEQIRRTGVELVTVG